jgi:hypothetical protein
MVLKTQIGGYDIVRVFMGAGSGINLIYARTLKAMNISLNLLQSTDCSFHEIVTRSANYPLGKIELHICFGDHHNFRREKWNSKSWIDHHSITRSRGVAFARFMAVPHYAYLVLRIPGPNGVITVKGNFEVLDRCDKEFHQMVQTFGMIEKYVRLKGNTNHNVLPDIGRSLPD